MELHLLLLIVAVISLSGVMMPGPVFAVTIAKGYKRWDAGAFIALGHGIVEFPIIALIAIGFSTILKNDFVKIVICIAGGMVLVYMGIMMLKTRKKQIASEATDDRYLHQSRSAITAGVITTAANPYFFLWWATIGATLVIAALSFGIIAIILLAIVHWSSDLGWDLFVSIIVNRTSHLWGARVQEVVFGGCGLLLLAFGVFFAISPMI